MTTPPLPSNIFMERRTLLRNARIALIDCIATTSGFRPKDPEAVEINKVIDWIENLLAKKQS